MSHSASTKYLEKILRLRGLIKRFGEAWRTAEIIALDENITQFKKRHYKRSKSDIRSSIVVDHEIVDILNQHGPKLWPAVGARGSGYAQWLYEAGSIPEYPRDLVYPQDQKM